MQRAHRTRFENYVLTEREFMALIRLWCRNPEIGTVLAVHADDPGNPGRLGEMIYEGFRVSSDVTEYDPTGKPLTMVSVHCNPPVRVPHTKVRALQIGSGSKYWNGSHHLLETHHGVRPVSDVDVPDQLKAALAELDRMVPVPA